MRIRVPDDDDNIILEESSEPKIKEEEITFQEEIRNILRLTQIPSKFVVDNGDNQDDFQLNFQILLNFTQLCREEIATRHANASAVIQFKTDELQYELIRQKKQLEDLNQSREEMQETMDQIVVARNLAQATHLELSERLKETLQVLQHCCNSKTLAERKMAQDLRNYIKKANDLRVSLTETSAKMSYYTTQVRVQTGIVERKMKPLYLDKERTVFMKANLNIMRQHIGELVQRVKNLQMQTSQLPENQ